MTPLDAILLANCIVYAGARAAGVGQDDARDEATQFVSEIAMELAQMDEAQDFDQIRRETRP